MDDNRRVVETRMDPAKSRDLIRSIGGACGMAPVEAPSRTPLGTRYSVEMRARPKPCGSLWPAETRSSASSGECSIIQSRCLRYF